MIIIPLAVSHAIVTLVMSETESYLETDVPKLMNVLLVKLHVYPAPTVLTWMMDIIVLVQTVSREMVSQTQRAVVTVLTSMNAVMA